jgi:hypothetical protein
MLYRVFMFGLIRNVRFKFPIYAFSVRSEVGLYFLLRKRGRACHVVMAPLELKLRK